MGYEKNMSFLVIRKLPKVWKKVEKIGLYSFKKSISWWSSSHLQPWVTFLFIFLLVRRFLRKPNVAEASDQFGKLINSLDTHGHWAAKFHYMAIVGGGVINISQQSSSSRDPAIFGGHAAWKWILILDWQLYQWLLNLLCLIDPFFNLVAVHIALTINKSTQ